jgi:hypothetical protein
MLLLFLFCVFSSSIEPDQTDDNSDRFSQSSWVDDLDQTSSSDYLSHLYCGTLSRGSTYLKVNKKALHSQGFEQGLAKIIEFYNSNPRPILNEIDLKWLIGQLADAWLVNGIWKGKDTFSKLYKVLLFMKRTPSRGISFGSLLTDAKEKHNILNPEEKRQSIAFIDNKKAIFTDSGCKILLKDLQQSIESRSFIIPDYASEKEIEAAINKGIKYFSEKMEHRDITVTGYYAYAQISKFLNKPENFTPVKVAIKMFWEKLKPNFISSLRSKDKKTMAALKIAMGTIIQNLNGSGGNTYLSEEIRRLMKDLGLSENLKITGSTTPESFNFENPKYNLLEIIYADLLGNKLQKMQQVYDTITTDPDWQILCPDMKLVADRLQKRLEDKDDVDLDTSDDINVLEGEITAPL